MDLPKNESNFLFDHIGEVTGRKWDGNFKVKCVLNMAEKRVLEIEKSTITADLSNPTGNLAAIAQVISALRVRVIDAPEWFKQCIRTLDFLDEETYFELYAKCLEAEANWLIEVKGESLGNSKAETTETPQQENQLQTS